MTITLMVLLIVSILSISLLTVSTGHFHLNTVDRSYHASYYIAESGITTASDQLEKAVINVYDGSSNEADFFQKIEGEIISIKELVENQSFSEHFGENPELQLKIEAQTNQNPREYLITSTGVIGDQKRHISKQITLRWKTSDMIDIPDNLSSYVGSGSVGCQSTQIIIEKNSSITGDFGTSCTNEGTIEITDNAQFSNSTIYVPEGAEETVINSDQYNGELPPVETVTNLIDNGSIDQIFASFPSTPEYDTPEDETVDGNNVLEDGKLTIDKKSTDGYTLEVDQDMSLEEISISGNRTLNVDTGGEDRELTVGSLDINNGQINVVGSGSLSLYVDKELSMNGNGSINDGGDPKQLNLYLSGNNREFTIIGSQKVTGTIFAEDADIMSTGSGGFNGVIITGGSYIEMSGSSDNEAFILAPFADFVGDSSTTIRGTVIAKTLRLSGASDIIYHPFDLFKYDLPFHIGESSTDGLIEEERPVEN
ncbi:hypothetical protein [Gracilibacillus sp. YIM 98692]|uniref:DUF7305 domain-containing protein n=1 Tax=Gracilibacillus sp. YIM 98692 TaxID=2663532 RepID=UPI001969E25A|nr:hypothetical protein [Gracilibacillus sp. YIM 98692]